MPDIGERIEGYDYEREAGSSSPDRSGEQSEAQGVEGGSEMFECMSDCIHLKACRRVQAIGRKHRLLVPRYCTEDCTAYRSKDEIIEVATLEDVRNAVNWAVSEIKDGMDWVETRSIKGHSIAEILGDE